MIFARRDNQDYADSFARYLPNDRLFASKFASGSNLRNLLVGQAAEMYRANGYLIEYVKNIIPDQTVLFIDEWESALGIPDGCFSGTGTLDERRRDVLIKLASLGVQTVADFQALADMFDVTATVIPGVDYPTPVPFPEFCIVVEWDGSTPEELAQIGIVQCLFLKLKPANVYIVFVPLNFAAQLGEPLMQLGEPFALLGNSTP